MVEVHMAGGAEAPSPMIPVRYLDALERLLIYSSIFLIPYDLPVVHEACLPLAAVAGFLMFARGDLEAFLAYVRLRPVFAFLAVAICACAVLSLYGNLGDILVSRFQQTSGWMRATAQLTLLLLAFVYPFYLAFCLRRHDDWERMLVRAAWWSLPIPILVGFLQFANWIGVPGVAHLPYVGGPWKCCFFRLTAVSRESSWFGSYLCVVLPFLIADLARLGRSWRKWGGSGVIGILLFYYFLGFSKSAYAAIAGEVSIAGVVIFFVRRPWRPIAMAFFGLIVFCTVMFALSAVAPRQFDRVTKPFATVVSATYSLFEPLLMGDTHLISIGTRLGMSQAGISMADAHPILGVGLGQFGFHAYNYLPLWGANGETLSWLSNDDNAWPSTSNIYTRLLAETGWLGMTVYVSFRLLLILAVGMRLRRKNNPDWWRDLIVFSILAALVAFDFHRDSFIGLDKWTTLGLGLACLSGPVVKEARIQHTRAKQKWEFFGAAMAASFAAALGLLLMKPSAYEANATVIPKSGGIVVAPFERFGGTGLSVGPTGDAIPTARFALLRTFWASRTVGEQMIAAQPSLVQAVLGRHVSPASLAQYIKDNVTILIADNQTTLTFKYRNPDPKLAAWFLTATIEDTDHAVAAALAATGKQATQLARTVLQGTLDSTARQALLSTIAAQELERSFDTAGENASFDYIDRPTVSLSNPSPPPAAAILFILTLAGLTASIATVARLLWPSHVQGFERKLLRLLPT